MHMNIVHNDIVAAHEIELIYCNFNVAGYFIITAITYLYKTDA